MDVVHYTLTGAQDWPMLITTLKLVLGLIGGLFSLVLGLLSAFWLDFRKQFSSHVVDGEQRCVRCIDRIDDEFNSVWDAIDYCFPRGEAKPSDTRRQRGGGDEIKGKS
jgi:hypothetical protein